MKITKELLEELGCYNFYLQKGNQILKIIFGYNLDLYWIYEQKDKDINIEEIKKATLAERKEIFTITKENYFIYSLFEELYDDIKNSRLFISPKTSNYKENVLDKTDDDLDESDNFDIFNNMTEEKMQERNEWYKQYGNYQKLFDGKTITWHSDEEEYSVANRVKITKIDDTFVLKFISPAIKEDPYFYRTPGSISIRFRNSGSTYDPYNMIFMRMYNKLQEYDPEYHQLHIEEITYQKKLSLKKQS